MATADDIRRRLLTRRSQTTHDSLLSSGSTVLNLACSGKADGAFAKGGYYFLVGDSSSGKSFLTRTMFAEACLDGAFKSHRLVDDDVENGANMDYAAYFGTKMAKRVEKRASTSVENFYDDLVAQLKKGPCVWLLDSMDALRSQADQQKTEENRKARAKGKEEKGSYGMGKAKANSNYMGEVNSLLVKTGSILVVIGQTRDNIGFDAVFNPKTRAGGNSLTFYAQMEIWTSVREKLKVKVNGKDRQTGIVVQALVKKNRQTGRVRKVYVPLFNASGIADVDGSLRYLIDEGHWKGANGTVAAPEFDYTGTHDGFVKMIEDGDLEEHLSGLVEEVWTDIDARTAVVRKSKYVEGE